MSNMASRDLRNHTAVALRRAAAGERITITVSGEPVAELVPPSSRKRAFLSKAEFTAIALRHQSDAGLRDDLRELVGETTDDLGPIR